MTRTPAKRPYSLLRPVGAAPVQAVVVRALAAVAPQLAPVQAQAVVLVAAQQQRRAARAALERELVRQASAGIVIVKASVAGATETSMSMFALVSDAASAKTSGSVASIAASALGSYTAVAVPSW
ncbi:MAG: hypothetical protein NVSMB26_08590 [Beijerinckiaceae bacterium]